MQLRPYETGDERAILNLFEVAFGKPMELPVWEWRFLRNPADRGRQFIHLMWDGSELVGHYAVSPVRMRVGDSATMAALSMTTMTHPSYAGRGIFTRLAQSVYAELKEAGYHMVWGFPNRNSHYGFVNRLNWIDLYQIPMLRLPLSAARQALQPRAGVRVVEKFDVGVDSLLLESAAQFPVAVVRDATYLNWRYLSHPKAPYTAFGFYDNDRLRGYAICKTYENGDVIEGDILDLRCEEDDEDIWMDLLLHTCHALRTNGAVAVNMWLNPRHPAHGLLERLGFQPTVPVTWLSVHVLDTGMDTNTVDNFKNWYISMGDSDVF